MKNHRISDVIVLIKGILMILISIIHTIAIYFGYKEALQHMPEYWAMSLELWFGLTGMFFLFIGVVDLVSYPGLKKGSINAWRYVLVSGIFPAVLGTIGTYFFRNDQVFPVFPVIIMLLGWTSFFVLLLNRKKYIHE
jgi:hypothetical protein